MSYLEEFQKQIKRRDFPKFFQLWEEYSTNDTVDTREFIALLHLVQESDLAASFGRIVESALPLWQCIEDQQEAYDVLKLLIDLQTTNSPLLGQAAFKALESVFGQDLHFKEWIRLVGLRSLDSFQGAISNYELLSHLQKGRFVYHTAGWGTSEVIAISPLREQVTLECENVMGTKHLTFQKAFRTLKPIPDESFLARRFGDPDALEKEARENPVAVVKLLLEQKGPMSAADIKNEFLDLVIPEKDWNRWWQVARTKLKKDAHIKAPSSLKEPFMLRDTAVTHQEQLLAAVEEATTPHDTLQSVHAFVRDLPQELKKEATRNSLVQRIQNLFEEPDLALHQELQALLFLEFIFQKPHPEKSVEGWIKTQDDVDTLIGQFEVVPFKKQALVLIRKLRPDWGDIFLSLLLTIQPTAIRDYLLKELVEGEKTAQELTDFLDVLLGRPRKNPEGLVWYFQKATKKESIQAPLKSKEGLCRLFDAYLVLLSQIEFEPDYRDLTKKMINILTAGRYAVVRQIFGGASLEDTNELLLLASKIQALSDEDKKVFHSLACVVHPSLESTKKDTPTEQVIWTTESAYNKVKERMKQIATTEMLKNTKEIEIAREHGDLRENAEYKFAKEKRAELQRELKSLADQVQYARVITSDDIPASEVGVGSVVTLKKEGEEQRTYTLLGPWDADADRHILSFQSKLAEAMMGHKQGDSFQFRDAHYTVVAIQNYLEEAKKA